MPVNYYIYSKKDFTRKSAGQSRMICYAKALATKNNKVFLASSAKGPLRITDFHEIEPNVYLQKAVKTAKTPWAKYKFVRHLFHISQQVGGSSVFIFYPIPFLLFESIALFFLKGIKKQKVYLEFNEVRKFGVQFAGQYKFGQPVYSIKKLIFIGTSSLSIRLLPYYDGVICISTSIEGFAKKYNKNTLRIPILTDRLTTRINSPNSYRSRSAFNIGFAGSICDSKENLNSFIEGIADVENSGHAVAFNLCGNITKRYRSQFSILCQKYSWLNYHGELDGTEHSSFLSQQDLLVIPRGFTLQNQFGFSTKLSDYLSHGKMVLMTDISDVSLYISDGINGFVVPPNDFTEMLKKLLYIIANKSKFQRLVEANAFETWQTQFNYNNYKRALEEFLTTNDNSKVLDRQ